MASPLAQFKVEPLIPLQVGGVDLSFTNSSLWMALAVLTIWYVFSFATRGRALIPGRLQSAAELFYEFIANMLKDTVGSEGRKFFPFIFSLFMFILFGNLLGMIPYSFTFTSHIVVTFALAMMVFFVITVVAVARHGFKFFTYFMPQGAPLYMMPLLVPIEILSYLSRPVSLSIRLFANMMAGHTMLKVFAAFVISLGVIGGWAPLLINVALTGFEILVAVLQAYVFTVLTCLYLHDAIHLH